MPVLCLCVIARKAIGTKSLMKLHPSLQLSTLSLGDLPGDVIQCKLDQCFGHLKNVIVIADDTVIVGKKPSHRDYDQALTTLPETARKCNVTPSSHKPDKNKVTAITKMFPY